MKYMGSKRRVAKHIIPIMVEAADKAGVATWVEPFVGGGNLIDKVPSRFKRIGYDLNEHVIMAMLDIRDRAKELPCDITEQAYRDMTGSPAATVTSWVRFVGSFGGKFEAGLARGKSSNGLSRNCIDESQRNAIKQQPLVQGVDFIRGCYQDTEHKGALIYCDPPYQGASGYKTGDFDHDRFFEWCRNMAKHNIVFVSEYHAPSDFELVWQGKQKTNFASSRVVATHSATEKLFRVHS